MPERAADRPNHLASLGHRDEIRAEVTGKVPGQGAMAIVHDRNVGCRDRNS